MESHATRYNHAQCSIDSPYYLRELQKSNILGQALKTWQISYLLIKKRPEDRFSFN